jgi:hypothetical protein
MPSDPIIMAVAGAAIAIIVVAYVLRWKNSNNKPNS